MQLPEFAKFYQHICQFDQFFGMRLTVIDPGRIEYHMTVDQRHISMTDYCHGGVMAAMMDAVLGLTALSRVFPNGQLCQTVEFKINYLATPKLGAQLHGTGEVEFCGNRMVVTSGRIVDAIGGLPFARGMGTFSSYPIEKRAAELGLSDTSASDIPGL